MAAPAALASVTQPTAVDDDEDDFLAQHGDIIDQMVEQHTKERQTQERSDSETGGGGGGPAPVARTSFSASVSGRGLAAALAPASNREQPVSNPFHANNNNNNNVFSPPLPDPHEHEMALSQQALKSQLAEKEGMVSILRDKLGKRDMENFQLKRKLQEVTNHSGGGGGGGGGGGFGHGLVQKSFALHNEQKIRQLTEELAFKDEEISEARRLKLQREEKLHFEQEEKQRLLAEVRELRARNETAEAEIMLRRQGGAGGNNGMLGITATMETQHQKQNKNMNATNKSPAKRPVGTASTDYYAHHREEALIDRQGSFGSGLFEADHIEQQQQLMMMMMRIETGSDTRTDIISESSDLIVAITSHVHSKDALEVEAAQQVRLNLSSGGSLSAITQVLAQFVVHRVSQAKAYPVEYRKLYRLGNGKSCLDSAVHLMHKILYLDYSSRKDAALMLVHGSGTAIDINSTQSAGGGGNTNNNNGEGEVLLESFVLLLSYCSWNEEVTAKVIEIITMIVSSFEYDQRAPLCCILEGILANEGLYQSSSKHLALPLSTLVYHLLECQAIARRVMKKEGLQMALVRFLERTIDFGLTSGSSSENNGLLLAEKRKEAEKEEEEEACTFVINRQGFSVCALLYRQALELLEGQKEEATMSLPPALANSFGKNVLSVMIFLNKLADSVELNSNLEVEDVHELYDDILIATLEGLSLLQVLLCDMNTARAIWKATFRASGSIRQFHITMGMILEGSLQLIDRTWPLMKHARLQIPSLWPCHAHAHDMQQQSETPIVCITDLASWIYQTTTTQMLQQHA